MDWFFKTIRSVSSPFAPTPESQLEAEFNNSESWVPNITPAESILEVRSILSSRLPPELVTVILDLANYWSVQSISKDANDHPRVSEFRHCNTRYLQTLPIIGGDFLHPLRQVVVTTVSKDQGWSSDDPRYHGTYQASWTWFELTVENPETGEEKYRAEVIRNVHAGREFLKHVTPMDDPRLFSIVKKGDTLSIWVRAEFPGWVNMVRSVEIETSVAY